LQKLQKNFESDEKDEATGIGDMGAGCIFSSSEINPGKSEIILALN